MDPRNLGERLDANASLDALTEPLARIAGTVLPRGTLKDGLHGVWLCLLYTSPSPRDRG